MKRPPSASLGARIGLGRKPAALCLGLACFMSAPAALWSTPAAARRDAPQPVAVATTAGEVVVQVVEEHIGPGGAEVSCRLPAREGSWTGAARLLYRPQGAAGWQAVALAPRDPVAVAGGDSAAVAGGEAWAALIPHHPRGTLVEYYIELAAAGGAPVQIPPEGAADPYTLTFKGQVSRPLLLAHIVCMMGGLIPLGIGFFAAWSYLIRRRGLWLMRRSVVIGFVLLFLGGVPLGIPVERQVFGTYWEGWPFGRDITDTKTGLLLLLWLVLLFVRGRALFGGQPASRGPSDRTWARWVIALVIFTVGLYLIPHENIKF